VAVQLTLTRQGAILYSANIEESVEVGRRQVGEPREPLLYRNPKGQLRLIIADLEWIKVPRTLALIEPLDEHRCKVSNLHREAIITIQGGGLLSSNTSRVLEFPLTIQLPEGFHVSVSNPASPPKQPLKDMDAEWQGSISALGLVETRLSRNVIGAIDPQLTLTRFSQEGTASEQNTIPIVLQWLELTVAAMQRPATSSSFYSGIAQAVARIIDVDRAEVILWDGNRWEFDPNRRFIHPRTVGKSWSPPSSSLLQQALATKKIVVYPSATATDPAELAQSVTCLHTAIACPILDVSENGNEILGVLYADRSLDVGSKLGRVMDAEQKLIAILATAIASSIAKMRREKLVTKYQQFFSHKVTEAISQNPHLLDGDDVEVTALFCDIRGFSKVTGVIGPKEAMKWMNNTLSELSKVVLDSDGVLVDYVGDEMFAMWGAPENIPDHAFRAVLAAREMMGLRDALSEKHRTLIPNGVDFGIGICTGPARVGNTGSNQKFKYGPMGTTVNLGSRIQGLTKQWNVSTLMSGITAACVPVDIQRRRLCRAKVVGIDDELDLYELLPENSDNNAELIAGYEQALEMFESGNEFRTAVRAFGELVQRFPTDGPSLVMLVRSVNELVDPSPNFSPVWQAKNK
jgi:adenylate cyclase